MKMPLDIERLEKVRTSGGRITARCPACAEAGGDRKGEHLYVAADGRFGCVLFPGKEGTAHRKRIWALAHRQENSTPGAIAARANRNPLAIGRSIKASLMRPFGTAGTAQAESIAVVEEEEEKFGTVGTPISNSRAYAREGYGHPEAGGGGGDGKGAHQEEKWLNAVPSVPFEVDDTWPPQSLDCQRRFGELPARLYPFLGRKVRTPRGWGRLKQVRTGMAFVALDGSPGKVAEIDAEDVLPGETLPDAQGDFSLN